MWPWLWLVAVWQLMLSCVISNTLDLDLIISAGSVLRSKSSSSDAAYVRITAMSSIEDAFTDEGVFSYNAPFKYRSMDKFLSTGIMEVQEGEVNSLTINGTEVSFYVPAAGEGVVGVFIADPCFNKEHLQWCEFGDNFSTFERTPAMLNAMSRHSDMHY